MVNRSNLETTSVDPMLPELYQVNWVRQESPNVFSMGLVPQRGASPAAMNFLPGQFNMLYVFGKGEVPISVSGSHYQNTELVHTIRSVGKVSEALVGVKPGDVVGVRGPFGSSWPVEQAKGGDVLVVAGGLGLAPLRPAIYSLINSRDEYRNISVFYGTRTPEDILFQDELLEWRELGLNVRVTVDVGSADWPGEVGVVTGFIERSMIDPGKTVSMICGPEIMMRLVAQELQRKGLPDEAQFISMERNMQCAIGFCGHCQFGGHFICKDGPIFSMADMAPLLNIREL